MESTDKKQIEFVAKNNPELRRLYTQHERYHVKLDALERRKFRTPIEEKQLKEIKALKLRGVEKMMAIVNQSVGTATQSLAA